MGKFEVGTPRKIMIGHNANEEGAIHPTSNARDWSNQPFHIPLSSATLLHQGQQTVHDLSKGRGASGYPDKFVLP